MSSCGHCGSNLTPADMSQPNCRYCGTVLAHYARAAEKVAVVNALMGDANGNGIPDVLEGAARLGTVPTGMPRGAGQPMVVVHSANGGPVGPTGPVGYQGQPPAFLPPMHGQPMGYPARRNNTATVILVVFGVMTVVGLLAGLVAFLVLLR
ncbi:MAG: zinc ribbon domain-containing protein [Polyangiaceae bacterium]|nr:zinc ribbon domain-containing protein [Polyangiaceae bacterium]